MHLRGVVAAAAGVGAAAAAHALDQTGRLPFVHEAVDVRTAMTPAQVVVWLLAAAAVSALAASTRVLLVGVPGAVLISATPELIGRGDPGAIAEPGALLGALVQVLLLAAIVAMALVLQQRLARLRRPELACASIAVRPARRVVVLRLLVDATAAPRGPPVCVQSTT